MYKYQEIFLVLLFQILGFLEYLKIDIKYLKFIFEKRGEKL